MANHTLMALRVFLGLGFFALLRPGLFVRPTRREWRLGALLGLLNFVGLTLQMLGLAQTTPALSGFFTSLASAWIPLLAFVLFRTTVPRPVVWGLLLGLGGAAVLGVEPGQAWLLGGGEALTLLSTFVFAVLILLLDRWGRTVQSAHLTVPFVLATGLPALLLTLVHPGEGGHAAWWGWFSDVHRDPGVVATVLLLTLLSTVSSTLLMATYQPQVPAARAGLIYFLEPVFAAAFSVALGFDALSARLFLGGSLILLGNLLVELPLWLRGVPENEAPVSG